MGGYSGRGRGGAEGGGVGRGVCWGVEDRGVDRRGVRVKDVASGRGGVFCSRLKTACPLP